MAERTVWQRRLTRIVQPIEAALVHGLLALLRLIPVQAASAIGGAVARTIGPLIGVTRRARKNLLNAFPEKSPDEIETIIRDMWENLGRVVAEYPHLSRMKVFTPNSRVEVLGTEHID
ncbi:MAG TPA: lauroyl acyltransferase, partial [Alphaproteobacteria bacterium]|nr:lauroyl acyltransferase [Alphaproteobacteria bacterium]